MGGGGEDEGSLPWDMTLERYARLMLRMWRVHDACAFRPVRSTFFRVHNYIGRGYTGHLEFNPAPASRVRLSICEEEDDTRGQRDQGSWAKPWQSPPVVRT